MDRGGKMMRARLLLYSAIAVILVACGFIGVGFAESAEPIPANCVVVYYFHGNFRCMNCHNMERWTTRTIESNFKKELESGKLVFKVINTDIKGNEHYMADYGLYTKSVVLALVKDGKETRYENLTKVWEHLRSEEGFCAYIKSEIERYLKEL